jgi:2-methylisocitrate lyase-like PEP mutase family enzyme
VDDLVARAERLRALHLAPEILGVVNVWDVASARVVAAEPETQAVATASHAVAAVFGYDDGEQIPRDLVLDLAGRIAAAVEVPVTADLEAGYGDPGETVRRAVAVGVVGGNLEDRGDPLPEAVARVEAAVAAAASSGVPFVLNARTDVLLEPGDPADRPALVAEAVTRGRAFLEAGADCVFAIGAHTESQIVPLVEAFGPGRLSVLGLPGGPTAARLQELGVARVSYGPFPQRVALEALRDLVQTIGGGGGLPPRVTPLT